MTEANPTDHPRRIRVWDPAVRLFHWTLAALVAGALATGGEETDYHPLIGYAILTLALFRLVWGFAGGGTARFSNFVAGPRAVFAYARTLPSRTAGFHLGHNPAGGWVVVALLALLLVQAALGLFATDGVLFEGPLARHVTGDTSAFLTEIHEVVGGALGALIALHVAAAFYYAIFKRNDLIGPMITGRKRVPPGVEAQEPALASPWRALAILAVCAGLVWLVVS